MQTFKTHVVIGEGWAALGLVGYLSLAEVPVCWITGSGSQVLSPLATLVEGPGVSYWSDLALKLEIDCGQTREGEFTREFKNKAFYQPSWIQNQNSTLWGPEQKFARTESTELEVRFDLAVNEISDLMRKALSEAHFPQLKKVEGIPVVGFDRKNDQIRSVLLASGNQVECEKVFYADHWKLLPFLTGLPKPLSFLRKRDRIGVLQARLKHHPPIGHQTRENFCMALTQSTKRLQPESGKEAYLWGHFLSAGTQSCWTICLSSEEGEDNHAIIKKLRRMKNLLDKMFLPGGLVPPEIPNFGSTVTEEQVRFEEEAFFVDPEVMTEPLSLPKVSNLLFLTDGDGPTRAFEQVGKALKIDLKAPSPVYLSRSHERTDYEPREASL